MKQPKLATQSTRLTALETRQAELEARIAHLEREIHRNFPNPWVTPTDPYPSAPPVFPTPIGEPACPICGIKWKDATNYVCNHDRCPSRVTYGSLGDSAHPHFICGGPSSSATAGSLTLPKSGAGPYGAPGTIGTIGTISKTNPIT